MKVKKLKRSRTNRNPVRSQMMGTPITKSKTFKPLTKRGEYLVMESHDKHYWVVNGWHCVRIVPKSMADTAQVAIDAAILQG